MPVITVSSCQKFDEENDRTLLKLLQAVRPHAASLVLLPVYPGPDSRTNYSAREREVLNHFTDFLSRFSSIQRDVYFFDLRDVFEAHPNRARLFIDNCCHLSEEGARLRAQVLFEKYRTTGLLAP